MKNEFKYKNEKSLMAKIVAKVHNYLSPTLNQKVTVRYEIDEEGYKYLYRHLTKINKVTRGFCSLSLNKTEFEGEMSYQVIIVVRINK